MNLSFKWVIPVVALTFLLAHARADSPFDGMLPRIPEQANMLMVVDNEALLKSDLGVQQNWETNYKKSAMGGLFGSPPRLLRLVVASQFDHHTLENQWQVGVADLRYDITTKNLIEATGGARDSVGGHEVTLTPQNTYLTLLNQHQIGMMCPANRQSMGRWLRTSGFVGTGRLSPFLRQSVDNLPKDVQAQLAIDMSDMFDAAGLRQRLKKSEILKDGNIDVEAATKLFSMVKGLTVALRVNADIKGELRVCFDDSPTFLQPVAKKLLNHALSSMGAAIDEFDDWETSVDGNAIVMRGKLSQSGARMIFSPMFRPLPAIHQDADAQISSPAAASKSYFNAVQSLIEDLKATKTRSLSERSFWYKQFADKIDALPMLNVDNDLLTFGAAVSSTFRGLANFATNTWQQQKTIAATTYQGVTVTPGASYYYGNGAGWGYGGTFPNVQSNYSIAQNYTYQAGNTEIAVRNGTWRNIEAATADIRKKMTQKYRINFD